ncbi:cell division protein ZipA [Rheinheimera riviphila]|uniref:Cell division protein ZipA n=1 Tax=Rheinheimera riviphila TaxID=1834037 RepID=A0A437R1G9_9GAMM|nr:cell division protein ZipA [Rheinheimera riviphila]RVU40649.1 cell division protein ZipA [Rheinheimera riviphila]
MAEEFRYALIIAGVLSMVALVIHGLWSARKNSHETKSRFFQDESSGAATGEGFDEFGVGKIRKLGPGEKPQPKPEVVKAPRASKLREPAKKIRRDDVDPQFSANNDREEPSMSFSADDDYEAEPAPSAAAAEPLANEVLILYVLMPEGTDINGAMLLPSLLTLGFKYGEMNIFHRHQDSAGSGEVLFSLANMFNPGTFDLEEMDKLQTRGLSLFMTLPGPGEALQNFNLMHNAAKKLAEEFGGQVLDGQRSMLTVQTVRHYVERIREFQRQQLLRQ